jgi:PAS domain S-box-containing protein
MPVRRPSIRDITERKRAEERFRRYFDLPLVGSAIYAPDKKWIAVNDTLCNLLGYSREELMEITWPEITHPDDLAENLRLFEAALSGTGSDAYTMDKRFIRKDGGVIRTMICAECVRKSDGAPDYFIVLVQDITDRKRAEKEHSMGAQRLEDITESASDWFWEMDADLRFTYISDRYEEVAGLSSDHFFGKRMDETYPRSVKRFPDAWEAYFKAVAARRNFRDFVHDDIRMDGLRRVISSTGKAIFDEDGIFQGYRGTSTDITDQRVAEEALVESEARLSEATHLAKLGTYLWDVAANQCIHCSEEYAAIHGLTPDYAAAHGLTPEEYIARASRSGGEFSIIHPDDREAYCAAMVKLRRGKQIEGE